MDLRPSWGGRALVTLALSIVLSGLLARTLDGTIQLYDSNGHRYLAATGSTGRVIGLAVLAVAALIAIHAILDAVARRNHLRRISPFGALILATVAWWLIASFLRQPFDGEGAIEALIGSLVLVAVLLSPPDRSTMSSLTRVLNFAAIAGIVFALVSPDTQLPCRPDKCGIFGTLFTGFLYQENGAARLVLLLLPVATLIPSWLYFWFTVTLSATYVAATGSRTSLLTLAVVVAAMVAARLLVRRRTEVRMPVVFRVIPLSAMLVSVWFFLTSVHQEFTGRGEIWARLREAASGYDFLFGGGPDTVGTLVLAYGARAFGEHGQAPHLFAYAGVPGIILFTLAMVMIVGQKVWTPEAVVGMVLLLAAATQFVTEPAWELNVRSMSFVCMLAAAGIIARGVIGSVTEQPTSLQRRQQRVRIR